RITSRSGSSYRRGRKSSALATLKMEVFAPIPIATDNTAVAANPGFLAKERRAKRRSCIHRFMPGHASMAQRTSWISSTASSVDCSGARCFRCDVHQHVRAQIQRLACHLRDQSVYFLWKRLIGAFLENCGEACAWPQPYIGRDIATDNHAVPQR